MIMLHVRCQSFAKTSVYLGFPAAKNQEGSVSHKDFMWILWHPRTEPSITHVEFWCFLRAWGLCRPKYVCVCMFVSFFFTRKVVGTLELVGDVTTLKDLQDQVLALRLHLLLQSDLDLAHDLRLTWMHNNTLNRLNIAKYYMLYFSVLILSILIVSFCSQCQNYLKAIIYGKFALLMFSDNNVSLACQ